MIFPVRVFAAALSCLGLSNSLAHAQVFTAIDKIDVPAKGQSEEPSLVTLPDARLLMSWTELTGPTNAAVRIALRDGDRWSTPVTVAEGEDIFVNYADFPSAVGLPDGTVAVQWLQMNGTSSYAYDVNVALSADAGSTFSKAVVPHRDGLARQHGFVTLLPDGNGVLAMWLDGRNYDTTKVFAAGDDSGNAMQLRATTLSPDAGVSEDLLLDDRTCTCCQTSAAIAGDGTVILAYRDRTEAEIRDISVVRRVDGSWSDPIPVSGDGWEIDACPVNGPAIDANGDRAALAWFTAADGMPAVKLAFSNDRGANFDAAQRLDIGAAAGRVDLLLLDDGSALVSWVEMTAVGEVLLVCRATPQDGCGQPEAVTISTAGRSIGFPRMAMAGGQVYVAWTEPTRNSAGKPDGGTSIQVAQGTLAVTQ